MRVLFLGSPEFAVPSLKALIDDPRYEVLAVMTQPDRKAGRGQKLTSPPVKRVASDAGIPVFQFPRIRNNPEVLERLAELQPALMLVVAFGQILPPEFFTFPPHGTLNVHASLLPKYRGAAPVAHAILNGERQTGVTIMRIDEGMDTGDILAQKATPVSESISAGELEALLAEEGAALLLNTIGPYVRGEISLVPQRNDQVSYAPRIGKDDGRISWNETALKVHNRVRAMNPWPVAFCSFRDQKLKIWRTAVTEDVPETELERREGTVFDTSGGRLIVRCAGSSYLSLLTVQLPNRNRVSAKDFVNGSQLCVGERLS